MRGSKCPRLIPSEGCRFDERGSLPPDTSPAEDRGEHRQERAGAALSLGTAAVEIDHAPREPRA